MPRRPQRNQPPGREQVHARPGRRGELGDYITPDGSAGRRRPLPAWLPEVPDPPVRGEESGVRLIPIDEEIHPPMSHVHTVEPDPVPAPPIGMEPEPEPEPAPEPELAPGLALQQAPQQAPSGPRASSGVTIVPAAPPVTAPPRSTTAPPVPDELEAETPAHASRGPSSGARPRPRRVLGVNIDAGVAYLGVVDAPDRVRLDVVDRLAPTAELETHLALEDFSRQVARLLRELQIDAVGIIRPLRYGNWRYSDAFARVSLETCIMVEAAKQSLRFESVGQQHASNVLGVPVERLSETLATRLGVERGAGWSNRCPALLVALAIGSEAAARF